MNNFFEQLRANVQASLNRDTTTAAEAFRQVIVRPPEPTPQEIWQDFISKPAQALQEEAMALGPDGWAQKTQEMLTLGEQLIGPSAANLMPYMEQFSPPVAEPEIPGYSLLDQALAEVEGYDTGSFDQPLQP